MSIKTVRVRILGNVQGVWYRAWTKEQADIYGLDGWVRNRHDGSVEAVFSGDADGIASMIDACWQGPKLARVEAVHVVDDVDIVEPGFTKRPTV